MRKRFYYKTHSGHTLLIIANKRPSKKNAPPSGTWLAHETDTIWHNSFEITWSGLSQLKYIGSVPIEATQNTESKKP